MNGASERSLNSAFLADSTTLYSLTRAAIHDRPRLAAGVALRGSFRMFFTYRGSFFWKMRRGMGDVVFAPFYEALRARGVRFAFFHRLENVRSRAGEPVIYGTSSRSISTYRRRCGAGQDYQPLIEVSDEPCWPSEPDFTQLQDGAKIRAERGISNRLPTAERSRPEHCE